VIGCISRGEFQGAVKVLKNFSECDFAYPKFKYKLDRYTSHAIDIVLALEANKNYIIASNLPHSKQQDLRSKYNKNYEDLKNLLNKVEFYYHQLSSKDRRSTHYLVRAVWISSVILFAGGLTLDLFGGLGQSFWAVVKGSVDTLTTMITNYI
jgi:hypothetical protein